jgi:hypothetical protein
MDNTESIRRELVQELNSQPGTREQLEAAYDKVWNPYQLREEFEVQSFLAPFVIVKRKKDGAKGTLEFQHHPRFYFNWSAGSDSL